MQNSTTVRPERPKRGTIVDRAVAIVGGFKDLQWCQVFRIERYSAESGKCNAMAAQYRNCFSWYHSANFRL
jgi:hypothetical protein